jgi:hypothetical protein
MTMKSKQSHRVRQISMFRFLLYSKLFFSVVAVCGIPFHTRALAVEKFSNSNESVAFRDQSTDLTNLPELPLVRNLGVGPVMAVAIQDSHTYIIGSGILHIFNISDPARPVRTGRMEGLGNTRQILVSGGIAYITSREDGLFVVDIADPAHPGILSHYDAIEFATGLALGGDVLFIACRSYGVESVDISDPLRPRHLSTVRTGEAQSVVYADGYLYAGIWASSELVTIDMRNPLYPVITDRRPLDGYGDGVAVGHELVLAATGHHSRQQPHKSPGDPGYGNGHGLEVFSIRSDQARPVFLARLKFPPLYNIRNDTWSVRLAYPYAFVSDTHNGVFMVDLTDPKHPAIVGRYQIPKMNSPADVDRADLLPGFIGGIALTNDYIYAAGGWTDLHILAAPGKAAVVSNPAGRLPFIRDSGEKVNVPGCEIHDVGGQVHDVCVKGKYVYVAAGDAGLKVIRLSPEFAIVHSYHTSGFAMGVAYQGQWLYVAEGVGGLSIWKIYDDGSLAFKKRLGINQTVRHVTIPEPGKYALLQGGSSHLYLVDISIPDAPVIVLKDQQHGLLYTDQFSDNLIQQRYASVFWHVSGFYWYDLLHRPKPVRTDHRYAERIGSKNGITIWRDQILTIARGGYYLLEMGEQRPLSDLPQYRVPEVSLEGKPAIVENNLYIADRRYGHFFVLDIQNIKKPQLLDHFVISGNPNRISKMDDHILIPGGYQGLLVYQPH